MSGQNRPSTPVKVPSSAASYTPATLDPDLRSQINTLLIRDGHVAKIQESLLHTLNAHPTNWPAAVQAHALTLLRSGEVSTFPALVRRVMDDVRGATAGKADSASAASAAVTNGKKAAAAAAVNGESASAGPAAGLAVPAAVMEEALRVTRESLESVVEIEDGGGTAA